MPPRIRTNVSLAEFTTLGIGGNADYFVELDNVDTLQEVLLWADEHRQRVVILGGGSNVLISDEGIRGLVIRPCFKDVSYTEEGDETFVTAGAGVLLDELIQELVHRHLWGLENLSAIPGTVGAVPIQNVGAYGVEAKDVVHHVTVYDRQRKEISQIPNERCQFGYRDSIFKHTENYIIVSVTLKVLKNEQPKISYRDLALHFKDNQSPSLTDIRNAVIAIRRKKFPDWKEIGTAGSFFKNPIIQKDAYDLLLSKYPETPGFITENGEVKISLGWILDQVCHMRGYHEGRVGLYEHQALVLVCEKNTSAHEVKMFSQKIIDRVFDATGIVVEREVTLL